MFTGLIEAVGELVDVRRSPGGLRLGIATKLAPELELGDSLAVNGVCLTVVHETEAAISCRRRAGDAPGDNARDAGHWHCSSISNGRFEATDGWAGTSSRGTSTRSARSKRCSPASDFHWLAVSFPPELARYIVHKGSIAVDGISLTVANLGGSRFEVQLVPFTVEHTNLKRARIGDRVNLECDMIGKYVARAAELILKP